MSRTLLFLVCVASISFGLTKTDELRKALKDNAVGARWVYDDWPAAVKRAAAAKKPLFVVFRCVP